MSDTGAAAAAYLKANPDVAANPYFSTHPLEHYQQYGMAEGRTWGATPTAGTSTVSTNPQQAQ